MFTPPNAAKALLLISIQAPPLLNNCLYTYSYLSSDGGSLGGPV